jgi:hypothetical protein
VAVLHGKQEMPVAHVRVSRTGNEIVLSLHIIELWAPCKALDVGGYGREIFVLATCSLQFANAGSAATLSQQEKNNSAPEWVLDLSSCFDRINPVAPPKQTRMSLVYRDDSILAKVQL